jgi:hypothetical protein
MHRKSPVSLAWEAREKAGQQKGASKTVTKDAARTVSGSMNTRITIERYGMRNWAVYLDGELLAVTLYKRGALTIQRTLEVLRGHFGYLPKVAAKPARREA